MNEPWAAFMREVELRQQQQQQDEQERAAAEDAAAAAQPGAGAEGGEGGEAAPPPTLDALSRASWDLRLASYLLRARHDSSPLVRLEVARALALLALQQRHLPALVMTAATATEELRRARAAGSVAAPSAPPGDAESGAGGAEDGEGRQSRPVDVRLRRGSGAASRTSPVRSFGGASVDTHGASPALRLAASATHGAAAVSGSVPGSFTGATAAALPSSLPAGGGVLGSSVRRRSRSRPRRGRRSRSGSSASTGSASSAMLVEDYAMEDPTQDVWEQVRACVRGGVRVRGRAGGAW